MLQLCYMIVMTGLQYSRRKKITDKSRKV
uniref:Uncharacterized protein n=1 Tax=Arundo donax TaxID=35708 RepID=A0A0A9A6C9_ARUDO